MEECELLEAYFDRLWPIMRSITGDGVRKTHDILNEIVPLDRTEIPSGTKVFDWTVPKEWVFREAYLIDPDGNRILDAATNTLHLVNYSIPFKGTMSRSELDNYLYSLPEQPDAIPYVTSYYRPRWGFCLTHAQREALPEGDYQVVVDTDLIDGSLTLSECVLEGETSEEVLLSTYTCHPSMANNELSGPLVVAALAARLRAWPNRRLTYRFVFAPETIGAITYLSLRGEHLRNNLIAGYVVTCVGLDTELTFQQSRNGNTLADRAARNTFEKTDRRFNVRPFHPTGSDERQYCSIGFDLPVGSLLRGAYNQYEEYHTSLDNKDLISFEALSESVSALEEVCRTLDANRTYRNLEPFCEPNLGSRDLYPTLGGTISDQDVKNRVRAMLWLCNACDGETDLIEVSEKCGYPVSLLSTLAEECVDKKLFAVSG